MTAFALAATAALVLLGVSFYAWRQRALCAAQPPNGVYKPTLNQLAKNGQGRTSIIARDFLERSANKVGLGEAPVSRGSGGAS